MEHRTLSNMKDPGLWPTFISFLLLFFTCFSGSVWSEVSFLRTNINGRDIYFGVFGYTGISQPTLGYNISEAVGSISHDADTILGSKALRNAEVALIAHILAAILALVAWIIMFWRLDVGKDANTAKYIKRACLVFATFGTLILWVFDLALFGNVKSQLTDNGFPADYGSANWLTLGAVIALLIEPLWSLLESRLPDALQRRSAKPAVLPSYTS